MTCAYSLLSWLMNTVFQQMPAPTFSTSTRQVGERKKNKNHNSMTASNLESWWIQSQGVDLTTLLLFIFIFIFLFFFSCFTLSLSGVVMFFKLVKNALTLNSRRWCGKLSFSKSKKLRPKKGKQFTQGHEMVSTELGTEF